MTPAHYLPVSDNVGAIVGVTVQYKHQEGNEKHDRHTQCIAENSHTSKHCRLRLATDTIIQKVRTSLRWRSGLKQQFARARQILERSNVKILFAVD